MIASFVYRCNCGEFKAKLTGLPANSSICHCHSCVAAGRYVDEKFGGSNKKNTSVLRNGGAYITSFTASNVEFDQPDFTDEEQHVDLLGWLKIGENGDPFRAYTKCCGTLVFTLAKKSLPTYCGLNGNCVYLNDGVTPFQPSTEPMNIMTKFAFDAENVPEPKCNYVTWGLMWNVVKNILNILNPFASGTFKGKDAMFYNEKSTLDTVPITWE
mmetsp:Transcript_6936/g.10125  ORF Transcript_6936/g.10125 Transcript_6936/m.10125 type:complete len:213 (-) Transcript_6936:73-711(-)|eukprot:CAMPEP_0201688948 /NCGR_PEP_ID=MMETSP0578-20130828/2615_1 /ASSEMBLY_ACC=CAM_ASM_000663 /TAXON_ID=267565 /ORGANISM="Skeletonema grethea, Strain CCMP 1804" /LENGTH=212 /DNA_ID=CAMNT_0048173433 /DNA_START=63 /DNA_END=701 /DNA_ORIENTATION=-